jgi:hypothetical protein
MSKPKAQQRTSKSLIKNKFLSPLQKKVFLYLANNDAKDIYETDKALKGIYRSTWNAFKQLEKKKLIKAVRTKFYNSQEYPRYWITDNGGIFVALCEGAKAYNLLKRTLEFYPERRDLQYFLEAAPIVGIETFRIAYFAVLHKGKFDESDQAAMMAAQLQHPITSEGLEQFEKILQKYPERQQSFLDVFKEMNVNMRNLEFLINKPKSEVEK